MILASLQFALRVPEEADQVRQCVTPPQQVTHGRNNHGRRAACDRKFQKICAQSKVAADDGGNRSPIGPLAECSQGGSTQPSSPGYPGALVREKAFKSVLIEKVPGVHIADAGSAST